jgi:hypothetical protein
MSMIMIETQLVWLHLQKLDTNCTNSIEEKWSVSFQRGKHQWLYKTSIYSDKIFPSRYYRQKLIVFEREYIRGANEIAISFGNYGV